MTTEEGEQVLDEMRKKLKFEGFAQVDRYTNEHNDCYVETWTFRHNNDPDGIKRKGQVWLMWSTDSDGIGIGVLTGPCYQFGPGDQFWPPDADKPLELLQRVISVIVEFVVMGPTP
jgi:hypothetical protein